MNRSLCSIVASLGLALAVLACGRPSSSPARNEALLARHRERLEAFAAELERDSLVDFLAFRDDGMQVEPTVALNSDALKRYDRSYRSLEIEVVYRGEDDEIIFMVSGSGLPPSPGEESGFIWRRTAPTENPRQATREAWIAYTPTDFPNWYLYQFGAWLKPKAETAPAS